MYFSINIFEQAVTSYLRVYAKIFCFLPTTLNYGYRVDCSPDIHGLKTKYSTYFIPHSYSTDAFALRILSFV
ncbi:unnamed protein product [Schistosoma haematobium]|nr:unnamed protein product [Schistosoma haematobium]